MDFKIINSNDQKSPISLVLVKSTSWRKSVMKELNEESGGRYTTIHLKGLEQTLRREKITNSALDIIVCLVEIIVGCDL